jgi:hypothetical protein
MKNEGKWSRGRGFKDSSALNNIFIIFSLDPWNPRIHESYIKNMRFKA